MLKDKHSNREKKSIQRDILKQPQAISMAPKKKNKIALNQPFLSANKPLQEKNLGFFKKHLHLISAIFSLIAIMISYHFWQDETQWVAKWMIIYTIFALFYWSIKPLIRRIREKWNK